MKLQTSILALAVATLTGCAMPSLTQDQMQTRTKQGADKAIDQFQKQGRPSGTVREMEEPLSDFRRTAAPKIRGEVVLNAAATPFAPVLSELGRKAGYSVAYAEGVDVNKKITVAFNGAFVEDAIRTSAFLAGYVAVIDKQQRTVMVSDVATYTFKLPSGIFTALTAQYNVGGNAANATTSTSGAESNMKADFNIAGKESNNTAGLTEFLTNMAGKNAEVSVSNSGHISVRANAQALRRVHDFMKGYAKDAMTQVEMEASVIEVALAKEFALGIQWSEVVNAATTGTMIGGNAAVAGALGASGLGLIRDAAVSQSAGGLSAFKVDATTSSLIKALAQFTEVNIVSQPKLLSMNNVPATFFDGSQVPYLGETSQSTTANGSSSSSATVTGKVVFAIDGVSFSAIPSVVDGQTVQITLMPVLSTVTDMTSFLNDTLKAPKKGTRQTYMRVLAESGKTLILGGIRYNKDSKQTSVPTSTSTSSNSKEVVILLRTKVMPAPNFDPIVNESL